MVITLPLTPEAYHISFSKLKGVAEAMEDLRYVSMMMKYLIAHCVEPRSRLFSDASDVTNGKVH